MTDNTTHTRDETDPNQIPVGRLDTIESGQAIAVRTDSRETDSQKILAGVVLSVPEKSAATIVDQQEHPSEGGTSYQSIIQIDGDTYWRISENELTDLSSRLEDRPLIKHHPSGEIRDPLPCSIAVSNYSDMGLIIPEPDGIGAYVRGYIPRMCGRIVSLAAGPLVDPAQMLPDEYDQPP